MATLEELQRHKQLVQRTQHLRRKLRVLVREHDDYLHTWFRRGDPSDLQLWLASQLYHARWQRICKLEEQLKQLEEQRRQLQEQLAVAKQHHQPKPNERLLQQQHEKCKLRQLQRKQQEPPILVGWSSSSSSSLSDDSDSVESSDASAAAATSAANETL